MSCAYNIAVIIIFQFLFLSSIFLFYLMILTTKQQQQKNITTIVFKLTNGLWIVRVNRVFEISAVP